MSKDNLVKFPQIALENPSPHKPLTEHLDNAEKMVRDMIADLGNLAPMVICDAGEAQIIIAYEPAPTATQRRFAALQIGNHLRQMRAAAYTVCHEVWIGDGAAGVQPSKDPDRREGVMIQAYNSVASDFRIFEIDRSGTKPTLRTREEYEGGKMNPGGTWDGLLTEGGRA